MLHTLRPDRGSTHRKHRVARGNASGSGTTGSRGQKGQQSRTGKGRRLGFEGGQTPLVRRQPKLGGFTRPKRVDMQVLNLETLEKKMEEGAYDIAALKAAKLMRGSRPIKLLGRGSVRKKFVLTVHAASKAAKQAIEKAGGSVTIVKR